MIFIYLVVLRCRNVASLPHVPFHFYMFYRDICAKDLIPSSLLHNFYVLSSYIYFLYTTSCFLINVDKPKHYL